jgi:hypothetical protein
MSNTLMRIIFCFCPGWKKCYRMFPSGWNEKSGG